jgi:hypothetical protein
MRHRVRDRWLQYGFTAGLIGVAAILGLVFHIIASAHAADQGYFNCFRASMTADQKKEMADWFRSDGVANCCDLADGTPGFAEDRADGVYIAPREVMLPLIEACRDHPDQPMGDAPSDHGDWIRADIGRILHKSNPIGVVVVWWVSSYSADAKRVMWTPRCVANLVRG